MPKRPKNVLKLPTTKVKRKRLASRRHGDPISALYPDDGAGGEWNVSVRTSMTRLIEVLANENPKGIIIANVGKGGRTQLHAFGKWKCMELAWVGGQLIAEAHGE